MNSSSNQSHYKNAFHGFKKKASNVLDYESDSESESDGGESRKYQGKKVEHS
jgi:hypothetical protein